MDPAWVALQGGRASGFGDSCRESSLSDSRPVSGPSHSQGADPLTYFGFSFVFISNIEIE